MCRTATRERHTTTPTRITRIRLSLRRAVFGTRKSLSRTTSFASSPAEPSGLRLVYHVHHRRQLPQESTRNAGWGSRMGRRTPSRMAIRVSGTHDLLGMPLTGPLGLRAAWRAGGTSSAPGGQPRGRTARHVAGVGDQPPVWSPPPGSTDPALRRPRSSRWISASPDSVAPPAAAGPRREPGTSSPASLFSTVETSPKPDPHPLSADRRPASDTPSGSRRFHGPRPPAPMSVRPLSAKACPDQSEVGIRAAYGPVLLGVVDRQIIQMVKNIGIRTGVK